MGSPEITKSVPKSPAVQDSPIFSYVSSLSPIKPVNVRPSVQAYENIDLPSPQPVFKTPHFSRPRNSNLLERSQHPALSGAENLSPGYANNITEFSENENITGPSVSLPMAQFISCTEKECAGDGPSPDEPCISPSSCVDVFLADPLENGDNLSSSPDFYAKRTAKGIQGDSISTGENQIKCCKEDLAQTHPRTSAVSVLELIDDCVEHSTCLYSKQDTGLPHTSENDPTSTEETTAELHVPNVKKCTSSKAVVSLSAPYQTEEDPGNVSMADKTMEINERSGNEQLVQEPKKVSINTDSFIVPASSTQHEHNSVNQCATDHPPVSTTRDCDTVGHEKESSTTSGFLCHGAKDVKLQTAKTGESDELDCTPQLHPGSPQNIQAGDNQINNSGQMSTISTENQIPYDQEEGARYQRGKRKRLQFEAAESLRMSIGCNRNSYNYATETSDVELSITPFEMETVNASHAESITTSGNKQLIQSVPGNVLCRLSFKVDRSGQYKGSSPVTAPRPSGIGLHLNSIGSVGSMNCNINMQLPEKDAIVQEKSFAEENDQVSQESTNCLASMCLIGHSVKLISSSRNLFPYAGVENNEEKKQGNQAINVPNSSVNYQSPLCVKPLNSSLPLKLIDRYMTPCTMKMPPSEEASKSEESTQTSPRKKRKKASENEGHKRCNCKKSKCLKLYCDCFASGSFCSEACACQECFNKPDYEDTVLETRQQIESRNPLAFAPKVVLRITDPPKDSGDSKRITPTSARHKSGCNCKKSLCLKKYCECYQAGVGCSLGCRCEGCKNTFGRKDGCGEISEIVVEHKKPKEGGWERDLSGEMEGIEVKRELANTKQCHSRLSPLTPSVQTSVGNDVPKPQFPASYYPSPESGASVLPSYEESPSAAMDSIQNGAFAEEIEGFSALVPYDPESEYHNAGKVDTFSPGWDGFPDICNLSPLLKTSPSAAGSSSVSKTRDRNVLQTKLFQKSGRISLGPLCWRSSPVTPLPQFGESKFVREPYSDSGQHCIPEDDTPEILKDTRSPIQAVKATSPNQKRVSPPHEVIHEARSNTPSGLRNSRKFILQSVPAFPPLTPYSNNTGEDGT